MSTTPSDRWKVFHWSDTIPDALSVLAEVRSLAKKHRQTLGFLPDAAFKAAADAGTLAVARSDDDGLMGYSLYRVTRGTIKLTHVCVDVSARRKLLGRRLVDAVIAANPSARAITASCRRDYGLDAFWESVGLSPSSERPGRNAKGLPLTIWFRQLGQLDLLSAGIFGSQRPLAVLDSNIVIDLYASPSTPRPNRASSQALLADWLAEEIEFAVSVQLDHELNDNQDEAERVRQSGGSQCWVRLPTSRPHDTSLEEKLLERFPTGERLQDRSLQNDVKHLADAIHAKAQYLVTNDQALLGAAEWLRNDFQISVVRPHELIAEVLDETGSLTAYTPGAFEHLDLHWVEGGRFDEGELEKAFLNYGEQERGIDFRQVLRGALSSRSAQVLSDDQDRPLALVSRRPSASILTVDLLRVARDNHMNSIGLQLTRQLRIEVLTGGFASVEIVDHRLPRKMIAALREDGYTRSSKGSFIASPRKEHFSADDWMKTTNGAPKSTADYRDYEWRFWPAKVWDDQTPCFVIPIKPIMAMDLLGYPPNLLPQKRVLGLSRRHVYFRSGHSNPIGSEPARILWYVSQDKNQPVQQFFAISLATNSAVFQPTEAHDRFNRFGVYTKSMVEKAAKNSGRVNVIEVEDTEVLPRPIGLDQFRARAHTYDVTAEFVSPRRIPTKLFQELMDEFYPEWSAS